MRPRKSRTRETDVQGCRQPPFGDDAAKKSIHQSHILSSAQVRAHAARLATAAHAAVVVVGQFPGARATRTPTSAAMDLKSMIHEAKSREMGLYAKFQEYDNDGSGFLDEVRVEGRVALWDVPPYVREVHLGGEQRAYARA